MMFVKKLVLMFTLIGLMLTVVPVLTRGEQLSIAGATPIKPIVDEASKEFGKKYPDVKFIIGIGGTARGIELAGKGEIQIGMSCREPNEKERAAYPDLKVYKIGMDANGVILHASNPVEKITADQIRKIYTGKITNWKELGGNDASIVIVSLAPKNHTYEVFLEYFKLDSQWESKIAHFKEKGEKEFSTVSVSTLEATSEVPAAMITKPNGIGFISVGATQALASKGAPLKMIALDGVAPTEENILNNSYALPRPLLLLSKGEPKGAAKDFIEYMMGVSGQMFMKNKGFFVQK